MADIEIIEGADNGNPPDTLREMYPKVNRNFQRLNTELTAHKNSTSAHKAEDITYTGQVPGNDVKEAIENVNTRISEIVAQSGDDITELVDSRGGYDVLGDRLDASDARLIDIAYNVKNFGMIGSGNDSAIIQAGIDYVATNGGTLYLPPGTYEINNTLSKMSGVQKPFSIVGSGVGKTILVRSSDFNGSMMNIGSGDNISVSDLTLVCNHDIYPNGNHGLVMFDGSNLRAERVAVYKQKNTGIMMYGSSPGNSFVNNVIDDCFVDGNNAAGNGILIANLSYSGIRRSHVQNLGLSGSPGYALQLKNDCRFCFISDSFASGSVVGVAFGNDSADLYVRDSIVSNVRVFGCISGVALGNAMRNIVNGVIVDMNNTGNHAIDIQTLSVGNSITGAIIRNVLTPTKSAARIRSGCTDNTVEIENINNSNGNAGKVAEFNDGAIRNSIVCKRVSYPTNVNDSSSLVTDGSLGSTNVFVYAPLIQKQGSTISNDSVTLLNSKITRLKVDTEGATATDNLATINGGVDGQIITIQQVANVRDVTIKNGTGNIRLSNSTDFIFTSVNQTLTLLYDSSISTWLEVSRGTAN